MKEAENNEQAQSSPSEVGKRFIIAGGGTGGHIFPAIAIANAIKKMQPEAQFLFVGAKGKMEMDKVPQAGYKIEGIDIAGFNRSSLLKNITLPFKLIASFFQVSKIIKTFIPDAVIGVGGYSSFPVLRYAQKKNIPTFIHESNSFAGKSNILLSKKAVKVFVAANGMDRFFPAGKLIVSGNPIRKSIANTTSSREDALKYFNLETHKKTILAVGGSLGARSINQVLANHVGELASLNAQLIWQTGATTADVYLQRGKGKAYVWVGDFIKDMDKAYAAADIVVSRSGAMSVAELCATKKAVIFVPYPHAAEDHQTANAQYLVDKNAALMVKDNEAPGKLFGTITNLLFNTEKQEELKANIAKMAAPNADEIIAREIVNSVVPSP